jgi:general secretion pathway protein G
MSNRVITDREYCGVIVENKTPLTARPAMSEYPPLPPPERKPVQHPAKAGCSISIVGWVFVVLLGLSVPVAALFFLNSWRMLNEKSFHEQAALQTVQSDVMTIGVALDAYRAAAGDYPTMEQGLAALTERPTKPPIPDRWYVYLQELPRDPWKQPFRYRTPATKSKKGYDVYSVGSDGVDGTADDIGNW